MRPLKKRCRILPAGGLGVSHPAIKSPPILGNYGADLDYLGSLVDISIAMTVLLGTELLLNWLGNIVFIRGCSRRGLSTSG